MGNTSVQMDKSQAGFTLVELAIVMIIIGLLIGGVLKGQELIANAAVTATVGQVRAIDAATTTFRDTYAALPGDMMRPGNRLPNCTGACDADGNGNNRVDTVGPLVAPSGENARFFIHLSAADLIAGIDPSAPSATTAWGGFYPAAQIAGGFHVAYDNTGTLGVSTTSRAGHYLILNNTPGLAPNGSALTALQAARIDRKMDDGSPNTGSVIASATACDVSGDYPEAVQNAQCDLFIRFQN